VFFLSCEKEKVDAPPAIIELITSLTKSNCVCDPLISEYIWRENRIFVLTYGGPACTWFPSYYDEKGVKLNIERFDEFLNESVYVRKVWSCDESSQK
jgi:hypothetical protein